MLNREARVRLFDELVLSGRHITEAEQIEVEAGIARDCLAATLEVASWEEEKYGRPTLATMEAARRYAQKLRAYEQRDIAVASL
jgi:hypothetical protein